MKRSLMAVVLLTFLLVTDTEAGWFRKAIKEVRKTAKRVENAVRKTRDFVDRNRAILIAAGHYVGKRQAEFPSPPGGSEDGMSQQKANELIKNLALECPGFGIDPEAGLSKEAVDRVFEASKGKGKQGPLTDQELEIFEDIIEAYKGCIDMEESGGEPEEE